VRATPGHVVPTPWLPAPHSGTITEIVEIAHARDIAERCLDGARAQDGTPLVWHIARVAAAAPPEARAVAWLLPVVERGAASEHELLAAGLTNDELRALRLLARPFHAELIARASGLSGSLARAVLTAGERHRLVLN
jgi:hypothetical protein